MNGRRVVLVTVLAAACSRGTPEGLDAFGGAWNGDDGEDDGSAHESGSGGDAPQTSGPGDEDPPPGGDEDGAPGGAGDCCTAQPTPGCGDAAVAACVCAEDEFCCTNVWDDACAAMVGNLGCGHCADVPGSSEGGAVDEGGDPPDGDPPDGDPPDGDPHDGDPPDGESTGAAGAESSSSEGTWGTTDDGGTLGGDCCAPQEVPGCADADVQDCVCWSDPFCCDTAWDQLCVDEVVDFGCGVC